MLKNELLEELYTTRWYISDAIEKLENKSPVDVFQLKNVFNNGADAVERLKPTIINVTEILEEPMPVTSPKLWYPSAIKKDDIKMIARGKYAQHYPKGAVVHYTAGRFEHGNQSAINTLQHGAINGNCYLAIDYDGNVFQTTSLDEWGYHAGDSNWQGLGKYVSNKLVGIEICNGGTLTKRDDGKFYTWYNKEIPATDVREIPANNANQAKGYYHKYSQKQEAALIALLKWLKANNPSVFSYDYVLGHDEVAGPQGIGYWRKVDPGGALSMSMKQLREKLKSGTI